MPAAIGGKVEYVLMLPRESSEQQASESPRRPAQRGIWGVWITKTRFSSQNRFESPGIATSEPNVLFITAHNMLHNLTPFWGQIFGIFPRRRTVIGCHSVHADSDRRATAALPHWASTPRRRRAGAVP
eukprot:scaffold120143_cov81-Phaeocystis_antarctica.AAC.1